MKDFQIISCLLIILITLGFVHSQCATIDNCLECQNNACLSCKKGYFKSGESCDGCGQHCLDCSESVCFACHTDYQPSPGRRGCDYRMAGWKIALIITAAILLLAITVLIVLWKVRPLRRRLCPCWGGKASAGKIVDSAREGRHAAGQEESHIAINDCEREGDRAKSELKESSKYLRKSVKADQNGETMLNVTQGKNLVRDEPGEERDRRFITVDEECVREYLQAVYEQ